MLKVSVALFIAGMVFGSLLMAAAAPQAAARADIADYLTGFGWRAPNSFEPRGYNISGTAPYVLLQNTANWTVFRNMGNLGIGNGSTATFGDPNGLTSNYSDYHFQAGDVSQEPLDPARELNLNLAVPADGDSNGTNTSEAARASETGPFRMHASESLRRLPDAALSINSGPEEGDNATEAATGNASATGEAAPMARTPENATFAAYHPIWAGQPVNDLPYEHPFATSISTYCRLVGLATPSGIPVNIAMRCLSYGY